MISGGRPRAQNIAILITNGNSTMNSVDTLPEASMLKESDVLVYVIAIGSRFKSHELQRIADSPSNRYLYRLKTFEKLNTILDRLVNSTCKHQTGGYHRTNACFKYFSETVVSRIASAFEVWFPNGTYYTSMAWLGHSFLFLHQGLRMRS